MIYVTSDPHFNHTNIIPYENRPFKDISHMNRSLIDNWNSVVKPDDTIYCLGDFAFRHDIKGVANCNLEQIFKELNGHKHLLIGNHDRKNRHVTKLPWESQNQHLGITVDGQRYFMCHYPMEVWEYSDKAEGSSIHLHGHIHSNTYLTTLPNRFCVCVELTNYTPVLITEYAKLKVDGFARHDL